jgi:hypothetical protein
MPVILGGNTGIYLASLTPPASPLILDTYPNAAVAYSLRKLRTAYSGSAIRVRRPSDNAEQDIGFVGNDLDTASLLSFVDIKNMWVYSEDISTLAYTKGNLNTTGTPPYLNVETAPDTTLTGDKMIENTNTTSHSIVRASGTILNATNYNVSFYAKQGERNKILVQSAIGTGGTSEAFDLDLTNGTVTNNTFINTPVVTAEANGWYRVSITILSATTSTITGLRIAMYDASNSTSYTGDGTSGVYVWGFQLTQSSSVLTYEKTGVSVTKDAFITTWYDQSTNANNATQATAGNQPRIVNGGVVDVENGKPAMIFDGSNDQLESGAFTLNQPTTQFGVGKINSGYNTSLNYTFASSTNAINRQHFFYRNTGKLAFFAGTTLGNLSDSTSVQFLFSAIFNSNNSELYFNNSLIVSGNAGSQNFGGNLLIGNQSTTSRWFGTQQEFIFYGVNQSINRVGIETNINTHYNIYP